MEKVGKENYAMAFSGRESTEGVHGNVVEGRADDSTAEEIGGGDDLTSTYSGSSNCCCLVLCTLLRLSGGG